MKKCDSKMKELKNLKKEDIAHEKKEMKLNKERMKKLKKK